MITINLNNIKVNLEEEANLIENYKQSLNESHSCRYCRSCDVVKNGKYERNAVFIRADELKVRRITLQRYKCRSCGRTSTHYPPFIVRNREYSLGTMFFICLSPRGSRSLSKEKDIPLSQIKKLRCEFSKIRKKLKTLLLSEAILPNCFEKDHQSMSEAYCSMYLRMPFEAYQRDMYLMPQCSIGYP